MYDTVAVFVIGLACGAALVRYGIGLHSKIVSKYKTGSFLDEEVRPAPGWAEDEEEV